MRQRRTTQERKTERHKRKIAESWQTIRTQQQQSVRGFKGLPFLLQLSVDLFVGFPFDFLIQPLFVRLPSQTAHVWGRAKDRNLSCRRPTGEVWISRPSARESECARPPVRPCGCGGPVFQTQSVSIPSVFPHSRASGEARQDSPAPPSCAFSVGTLRFLCARHALLLLDNRAAPPSPASSGALPCTPSPSSFPSHASNQTARSQRDK